MVPRVKVNYGWLDLGRAVFTLENRATVRAALVRELEALVGEKVLLTPSGRGGLYILLSCLPQTKVVIPGYTCSAVADAVRFAGKRAIYVETEADGFNMQVEELVGLLDADTIVIATHQFGFPCAIRRLVEVAKSAGAFVIEDAAASLGTRSGGQLTGTFGDAAFFSFDSTKLVHVPLKAGFICMRDAALATRCECFAATATQPMAPWRKANYLGLAAVLQVLKNRWGYRFFHWIKFDRKKPPTEDGTSYRDFGWFYKDQMTEWQATIALPQILQIDRLIEKRRTTYAAYHARLRGVAGITLPPADEYAEWAPIRFPVLVPIPKESTYWALAEQGVDCAFSFTYITSPREFTRSHEIAESVLDLPFYQWLNPAEFERVVSAVLHTVASYRSVQ